MNVKFFHLLNTISLWPKTWYVETHITIAIIPNQSHVRNIFHFTTDGDVGVYGYRVPAIFLLDGKIQFRADTNGHPDRFSEDYALSPFAIGTKFHVRIEQVYDSVASKYMINAYVNRILQYKIDSPHPTEIQNVKVYTCDKWYDICTGMFVLHGFRYGPLHDAGQ